MQTTIYVFCSWAEIVGLSVLSAIEVTALGAS